MAVVDKNLSKNADTADYTEDVGFLNLDEKKIIAKSNLRRIEVSELPSKLPDFRNSTKTKDSILSEWLTQWIEDGIKKGSLQTSLLLPKKSSLASYLGVSIGTVQTAIRLIEDKGYVESKQRIGTFIRDFNEPATQLRKQISKRDQAISALKRLILKNSYASGEALPSSRELAKIIGSAPNTTRLALEFLASNGIIESKGCRGNKANWILKEIPALNDSENEENEVLESDTLVDQVERDLKSYISKRHQVNDRLPSHFELGEILKVSIKTVHDAIKRLVDQGILQSKRGRYGTFILRLPSESQLGEIRPENSIFAPAEDASFYNYEKVEQHIKQLIQANFKEGDKLPAMGKLALELKVSSNTIRKALQRLSEQNVVKFSRGRYGGTFVVELPKEEEAKAAFTWLSVNPEHVKAYVKN